MRSDDNEERDDEEAEMEGVSSGESDDEGRRGERRVDDGEREDAKGSRRDQMKEACEEVGG